MVRTGRQYLAQWSTSDLRVWFGGEAVRPRDVPTLARQAETVACYYDQHHRDPARNIVPWGMGQQSVTLLAPDSHEALVKKAAGYRSLASNYFGILGRPPDYVNVVLSAWAAQPAAFGEFAPNVVAYANDVRKNDWFVTHTTSELRGGAKPGIRVIAETDAGVVLSGARAMATSAALCDEILIAPTRALDDDPDKAIICAVPADQPGLKFICRGGAAGHSTLSSNYDETDALVLLDRVFVPWERVFACRDLSAYATLVRSTGTSLACSLQTNARAIAKLELLVSLLKRWEHCHGVHGRLPETLGRILRDLTILNSLQAESLARAEPRGECWQPHDQTIEAAKIYFMECYPKIIARLREDLGPQLFYLFRAEDLDATVREELGRQWGIDEATLSDRQELTGVLHDLLASSFGVRQELYEQFYAGNPRNGVAGFWRNYRGRVASEPRAFAPQNSVEPMGIGLVEKTLDL